MPRAATLRDRQPASEPGLRLQPLGTADLDAVMAIEVRCYSHPWTRGNFIDSLAAGYLVQGLWQGPGAGALAAPELLAYSVAQPGADEMHLLNLSVAPHWQRQGHAKRLLDALEAECRLRRMPSLWLEVRQSNAAALALYRARGFAELARRRGYYPATQGREDAIVMRLELRP